MSDARLFTLARKCKRRGGDCPCEGDECQAGQALAERMHELEGQASNLRLELVRIATPPATIRPDWTMPDKPEGDYRAVVVIDYDEWHPHWCSETERSDVLDFPEDQVWPFVEPHAYSDDWERAGFEVV